MSRGEFMDRDNLFRLALVTHTDAPQTINKYISLLTKLSIMDSECCDFTLATMCQTLKVKFDLEFSEEEVKYALNVDKNFEYDKPNKKYSLKPEGIQKIKELEVTPNTIESYINDFFQIYYKDLDTKEKARIKEMIMQYIYFSFNAGKESLKSLMIMGTKREMGDEFKASNYDKEIINAFLDWDNTNKNECIYNIVSYCIDYGMLTTKKSAKSYKKIFEGLHFYLDSNIIFRLIGLNNQERKEVIQHFVNKCNEVGIKLHYTNITYLEVQRVIYNAAMYVNLINDGDEPLAPSELDKLGEYENKDLYEIYYNWCKEEGNDYDNYNSYQQYLKEKIDMCLSGFEKVDISDAEYLPSVSKNFLDFAQGLRNYKNGRVPPLSKPCSLESAKTDINNFLYIKNLNSEANGNPINIKSFFITADAKLYQWSTNIFPGVPTVFLPSEWLSIILKYTSRTDSDYNTFCKFLNLRLSISDKQKQKCVKIIQTMNDLTSDVEIKTKIIRQLSDNKQNFIDEEIMDGSELVRKAFDVIIEEQKEATSQEMDKKIDELKDKNNSEIEIAKKDAVEQTRKTIAQNLADDKTKIWIILKKNIFIFDALSAVVSFLILFFISKINTIENWIFKICNSSKILKGNEYSFSTALSICITAIIITAITIIINILSSEQREKRIIKKQEIKFKNLNNIN